MDTVAEIYTWWKSSVVLPLSFFLSFFLSFLPNANTEQMQYMNILYEILT